MSEPFDKTPESEDDPWHVVDRLLEQALDLPEPERDRFLREQCGEDHALLRRVRRLLTLASDADTRLEGPDVALVRAAWEVGGDGADPSGLEPGALVGRYRILGELGRGGMATVYDAERADGAFERRVAVKLLRRGLDTEEIVGRFLSERQILSGLEHANIARLIDGGASADGRPYLVMERVSGEPITDWAEKRGLSVAARLELFCQVAEAVQHAHQRLIIHRDLKPSNILVDEQGTVKLLDFGIAKLLSPTDQEALDSLTRTGVRPLTPAYASPEQILGEPVTTTSDVHQLGAVLYELLTGRRPFEGAGPELRAAIVGGRVRRPSEVVDDRARSILRGDLDAIVLTALRVEPERRYASAAALEADIRRYLARQPVQARPDTLAYRAGRFARRRPEIVAAATVLALLLGGYVATLVRHADRLEEERDRARLESAKAQEVSSFLVDLFAANDPDRTEGDTLTAVDLLARGEERVDLLAGQPELQVEMLRVIGQMYARLGRYERAESVLRSALALVEELGEEPSSELAGTLEQLGDIVQRTGRYAEADSILLAAIDMAGEAEAETIEAGALNAYGHSLLAQGDYEGAEEAFRGALAAWQAPDGDSLGRARTLGNLAVALEEQGRFEAAESTYMASLDIMERIDPEHTSVASTLASLGRLYVGQGNLDQADSVLGRSLELNRSRLGDSHVALGLTLNELGMVAARRGVYEDAEQYFREGLEIQERALGRDHPEIAVALNNVSYTLIEQGRLEDALPLRQRALEIARAAIGKGHENTGWYAFNLGYLHERLGHTAEAEAAYREALAILRGVYPDGHFQITTPMVALGDLLARTGRPDPGIQLLREALQDRIDAEAVPAAVADVQSMLGAALGASGRRSEARELLELGLAGLTDAMGPDASLTRAARARLEAFERR